MHVSGPAGPSRAIALLLSLARPSCMGMGMKWGATKAMTQVKLLSSRVSLPLFKHPLSFPPQAQKPCPSLFCSSSFSVMLRLKALTFLLLLLLLALCSGVHLCDARSGTRWSRTTRGGGSGAAPSASAAAIGRKGKARSSGSSHRQSGEGSRSPTDGDPVQGDGSQAPPPQDTTVFSVVEFGAKGDGVTDDTQAFEAAWAAACKVEASTVLVPSGLEFVVGPISFSGPYCKPNILFQLDGTILAQTSARAWGSAGLLQWLEFTKLTGIAVQGSGVINGRGQDWWTYADPNDADDESVEMLLPRTKPTALRFYGSSNVTVAGITIVNSSQCHLKFDSCEGVMVHDLSVSSPEDSPNTDGIHLQNSRGVDIHHATLACGDDCISIQTGCSDVNIHSVNCGPGHGISIGGLGRFNTKACVSNVTVRDVKMFRTTTGVRIKTWQ
ncbi:hypothetical protein ACJX0J_033929, partial [Zea mays]